MPFKQPLLQATQILGGRWRAILLYLLLDGPKRFNDLQKRTGISHRALTQDLRKLEKAGLVSRTMYPEMPVRVEYKLTEIGLELRPIMQNLHMFGQHLGAQTSTTTMPFAMKLITAKTN